MKTTTRPLKHSMNCARCRFALLFIPLIFVCVALSPRAQADCRQGCDTLSNTFLGDFVLLNPTGTGNTGVGYFALELDSTGIGNTAVGVAALSNNTTGSDNTAIGEYALSLSSTGASNTAVGGGALEDNTTGGSNTAIGLVALASNTTGGSNTAIGASALVSNTTGGNNTAIGNTALGFNTNGADNTATGFSALNQNTTGGGNVATGTSSLFSNTTGSGNTAVGDLALYRNTVGHDNTATGSGALSGNTTGSFNTAIGEALFNNTTGNNNTAAGSGALSSNTSGLHNTAMGDEALEFNTTGSSNIAFGVNAGSNLTTGSNNIDIGNGGVAAESNTIRLGTAGTQTATFIAGIRGVAIAGAQPVGVNASGQLGVRPSSARFKEAIKPIEKASEAILSLQPVTFRYKKELDATQAPQFGLVAEDVAKVAPDLVTMDDQGKPYTVRYDEVNALLLNEFLKEHRTVQEQQKQIDTLKTELNEQKTLIQKVSAQLELNKAAPQTVCNRR